MSPFDRVTSGHLGRRVSALVDDQLPPDERERALAHLVGCPQCRMLADAETAAKSALRFLDDPAVPSGLLDGLLDLGGPAGPLLRDRPGFPGSGGPGFLGWSTPPRGPLHGGSSGRPGPLVRTSHRPVRVALAAVGAAGASVGLAFAAGGPAPAVTPAVVPAFDRFATEHVRTTSGSAFSDPAVTAALLNAAGRPAIGGPAPLPPVTSTLSP